MAILINASNLHLGGAVQVATSFISELTRIDKIPNDIHIWVSSEVHNNLISEGCDLKKIKSYKILNSYGIAFIFSSHANNLKNYDIVFTIFGPLYRIHPGGKNVVGFAQPWIIYNDNELMKKMKLLQKIKIRLKYEIQKYFFRKSDILVVETEFVKTSLIEKKIISDIPIVVVPNCISSIYVNKNQWEGIPEFAKQNHVTRIGFLGKNYEHKNTKIFPVIKQSLLEIYCIDVKFYVTFSEKEWANCSAEFKRSCINVGTLNVAQCPNFYQNMDAIIFPSLLECFSASPLEALVMKKPLFASDRQFNRDICATYAVYFDPNDPIDFVNRFAVYYKNNFRNIYNLESAQKYALGYSNAKKRAENYLNIIATV